MSNISKSRLLATSAIAGLSVLNLAPSALAQDAFGIHNDQSEPLEVAVAEDEEVVGDDIGIYADNGPVIVDNQGEIRGNGTTQGGADSRPSGGIVIAQAGSSVTNSGDISGGSNGIATSYFFSEDENGENLPPQPLAADTVVVNSGAITGEGGAGVGLTGGGSVTNSGLIQGYNSTNGSGANGIGVAITEFPDAIDADATGIGSIVNTEDGLIQGQTFGVVLQGGGTIENDGMIRSTGVFNPGTPGVTPIGVVMGASEAQEGRSATLDNNGVVLGFLGVVAGGSVEATIDNGGIINGQAIGIIGQSTGNLVINNAEDAEIASGGMAIVANTSTLIVDNAGTIRSQSQHGINILSADAVITNSGTITGAQSGITTNLAQVSPGVSEALATNTSVTNTGTIIGNGGTAVSLTGGGSVVNNGTIRGLGTTNGTNVPGIGIVIGEFAGAVDVDATGVGSVINQEDGLIEGQNFGIVLQGGGTIDNEGGHIRSTGQYNPATPGTVPFGIVMGASEEQQGRSATLNNDHGVVQGFFAVLAGGSLETATIDNDGIIVGAAGAVLGQSTGDLIVNNGEGAEIAAGGNGISANTSTLTVENAGTIRSDSQNGINILTADGTINNSGTIQGGRSGITTSPTQGAGGLEYLAANTRIANSGTINGQAGDGIYAAASDSTTVIDNAEGGVITGTQSGVHVERGALELTNAGEIRGEGLYDGFDAPPDGGVTISGGVSSVNNSGTISGARFGITTAHLFNPDTQQLEGLAVDTTIVNSGTIAGDSDDGIRLIGGGTVTNSGTITGSGGANADGISAFLYNDQDIEGYGASVTNSAEGVIAGNRFGIILSGGGDIDNAGSIEGARSGIVIQRNLPGDAGLTGNIVNSGSITGGSDTGVQFNAGLEAATLDNNGTITGATYGVFHGSEGELQLDNSGDIVGGSSGVIGAAGTIIVDNSGTIRGSGTVDTAAQVDAGIAIGHADSAIVNSGTISGAGTGISTFALADPATGQLVTQTTGTVIENSGTITGDNNDGIRLFGGGTIANGGTIEGLVGLAADGIQINRFGGQALDSFAAEIANEAGGEISGVRYGIIALGGGGTVANAGDISGGVGGVLLQGGAPGEGTSGSILNSGNITAANGLGAGFAGNLASGSLENSGAISGLTGVLLNTAASTAVNAEGGSITGVNVGLVSQTGTLHLTNAGTITGTNSVGIFSAGQTTLVNSGTISGANGAAVVLGAFDDQVTLQTGSVLNGALVGGEGTDTLTLDGDILELTEAQQIGTTVGFEQLTVEAGYWNTSGYVGEFNGVTINEGGALQVNEIEYDEGLFSTPIFTPAIANNGLLVVNFDQSDVVSGLGQLSVTGIGGVQLIGEGVFTLDTDSFAHHGGTTVSNGGLILTGTLLGNVTTEGDGFFQLGAGGTEGSFSGDIVNNGRFVFNRSDDYDFLGAFSGNGTLDKMGDSVLTFMGDYSFEGVTNILGGAVRIGGTIDPTTDFNLGEGGTLDITGKDQTIGGLAGEEGSNVEMGENNLTVAQEGDSQFGGTISGSGSFTKEGDGTLNLTGNSDYSGPTSVNGGTLAVNGSIVSDVTVNNGGTLGGNGTVGSTTVTAGGTIAPGNSIGQLTVNGDLAFAAGSTFEVEVNAAGQADRLDATGAVTIASTAGVAVLAEEGNYNPRTDYVILTGANGVTGTFGSVTTDLAFLDPLLRYSANSVTLSLYRNDIDFADVALGFNQASVATAVQSLGIDNPLFEAVLVQNAATAQTSFGDLSGEILANTISGLTDDSRHLRNALLGMTAPEEGGAFVWGSAFGGWGKFDAQAGGRNMDTDHKGMVAGFGFGGNGFAAALSAGISGSDFRSKGRNDHADVQSKYLAAHATYGAPEGGFRGTIGLTYAWHDIDTSRAVTVVPFAQTLTSKNDADTLQLFGELGYDLATGKTTVTPFVRLAHVKTNSEGFAEAGGNAALVVADIDQKATFLSLGARARFNAGEAGFQPYVSAAWNRAFDDRGAIMVSRFAAGGTPFGIIGSPIPKNSAEVEAGFDYSAGAFSIGAAYTGTLASDRNTHGVRVTARITF